MTSDPKRDASPGRSRPALFVGLALLPVIAVGAWIHLRLNREIQVSHPREFVEAARALIQAHRKAGATAPEWLTGKKVPPVFREVEPRQLRIDHDRVSVVLYNHPDGHLGVRIWAEDARREHQDQPTRYPDLYRFIYSNDYPESPTNIP